MRNRAVKSELKTAVRHVKDAVAEGNGKDALRLRLRGLPPDGQGRSKGVIHKNQAANRKSGIMRLANTVVTAEDIAAYEKPAPKPQKTGSRRPRPRPPARPPRPPLLRRRRSAARSS
ncbi:MAG: 30S ribosomal protein S20 [Adlercreutzia equolifaciens]